MQFDRKKNCQSHKTADKLNIQTVKTKTVIIQRPAGKWIHLNLANMNSLLKQSLLCLISKTSQREGGSGKPAGDMPNPPCVT